MVEIEIVARVHEELNKINKYPKSLVLNKVDMDPFYLIRVQI